MYTLILVLTASLGPFLFGYHLSELNALYDGIACRDPSSSLPSSCLMLTTANWATVQSIYTIGGLLGALLLGGKHASRLGHIQAMRLVAILLLSGSLLEAGAPTVLALQAGRALSGIGAGAATVTCPVYIARIAPQNKKGFYGAFTQIMINLGIFCGLLVGALFAAGSHWRMALVSGAVPAFVMFVGLLFMSDSLQLQRTNLTDEEEPLLASSRTQINKSQCSVHIEDQKRASSLNHASFIEVIRNSRYRRATIAISITMMAQQLTGINSMSFYSVSILSSVVPTDAAMISIAVAAVMVLATVACSPLSDTIGRKPCLLASAAGMGISSTLLAAGLSTKTTGVIIPALILFVCSFSAGLGPVPFMLASELVDVEAIGAVSSWALTVNWLASFVVAESFPFLNKTLPGGKVFWVFAGLALFFGSIIAWTLPESKGKKSVDEVWGDDLQDLIDQDTP